MIYYVGDIHGRVEDIAAINEAAISNGVDIVVQVGDFGIHWPGQKCPIAEYFESLSRTGDLNNPVWYTCGGNHDNWDKFSQLSSEQGDPRLVELAPNCYYVPRGEVVTLNGKKHIFFGGAESTDKHMRKEGSTWWKEETPSVSEFNDFFEALESERPDVVVTHEAPTCIDIKRMNRDSNPTPRNLQNILRHCEHTPARWYFGHHHIKDTWDKHGVRFYCCGLHGEYHEG